MCRAAYYYIYMLNHMTVNSWAATWRTADEFSFFYDSIGKLIPPLVKKLSVDISIQSNQRQTLSMVSIHRVLYVKYMLSIHHIFQLHE